MSTTGRIDIAKNLFAGWSSGNPDAPEPFMTPDAVLFDVASGRFEGWPAIRAFFANGLTRTRNLTLIPDDCQDVSVCSLPYVPGWRRERLAELNEVYKHYQSVLPADTARDAPAAVRHVLLPHELPQDRHEGRVNG